MQLQAFSTTAEALAHFGTHRPEHYATRIVRADGGIAALYADDVAYRTADLDVPGRRHRLWMLGDGWRYQRDPADA